MIRFPAARRNFLGFRRTTPTGPRDCECIGLEICPTWNGPLVSGALTGIFEKAGTPSAIVKDGGSDLNKRVKLFCHRVAVWKVQDCYPAQSTSRTQPADLCHPSAVRESLVHRYRQRPEKLLPHRNARPNRTNISPNAAPRARGKVREPINFGSKKWDCGRSTWWICINFYTLVLPFLMTYLDPRTEAAGFMGLKGSPAVPLCMPQ